MIGIYKITNNINGKAYIGQSIHVEERLRQHQTQYTYKDIDKPLYLAFTKYGIENFSFEVLEECKEENLNEREIYWIDYYDTYYNGYNANRGGTGRFFDNSIFFKAWDDGLSVGEIAKKYQVSPTTVRNYLLGYKNYSIQESNARGGKIAYNKGGKTKAMPVNQYDLKGNFIKQWPSKKEIQRQLGIEVIAITRVCRRERQTTGGYIWRHINDDEFKN